jgi:hypothetical protein
VSISDVIGPRQRESFVSQRRLNSPVRFQLGLSGWTAVAGGLLIVTALAAAAFLAIGVFVLVLPLLLIAPLARHFLRTQKPANDPTTSNRANGIIIDGDFRVIDHQGATERPDAR